MRAFQEARGLRVDGICGPQTWSAVVESGYRLGDRLLYRRRPMLRGDDVAELQRRLNGLGFDAGREDGILGDDTTRALVEFQRNMGLPTDGICGAATLAVLDRVGGLADGSVASVREREALRRGPHRLEGRRVFVAAAPGFETLARTWSSAGSSSSAPAPRSTPPAPTTRSWRPRPTATPPTSSSPSAPATRPAAGAATTSRAASGPRPGYAVADAVSRELAPILGGEPCVAGRTYAVLRETRMAAVICEPVAADDVDSHAHARAARGPTWPQAVVRGVRRGVEQPPHRSLDLSYSCARKESLGRGVLAAVGPAAPSVMQPVDPLEVLEGRELDHDLAPRRCPSRSSPGSRGGRRAAPRARPDPGGRSFRPAGVPSAAGAGVGGRGRRCSRLVLADRLLGRAHREVVGDDPLGQLLLERAVRACRAAPGRGPSTACPPAPTSGSRAGAASAGACCVTVARLRPTRAATSSWVSPKSSMSCW